MPDLHSFTRQTGTQEPGAPQLSPCKRRSFPPMACPNCGSWSVRADRSLAGRMVCGRCGSPLTGQRSQARRSRRHGGFQTPQRGPLSRLQPAGWGLLALLSLGAGLALLEPPPGRQETPRPGQSSSNLSLAPSSQNPWSQAGGRPAANP